jgi:hypothetical protein
MKIKAKGGEMGERNKETNLIYSLMHISFLNLMIGSVNALDFGFGQRKM